jgi:class 3 adenylate cyclase
MPWNNTPTTEQRLKFVTLANSGRFSVSEWCLEFGVSRKSGHKWLVGHAEGGAAAVVDGSRAPHSVPQRTDDAVERLVVSERRLHPTWGAKNALQAVQMALDLQQEMTRLNESWRKRGYDPLHIGIHTGFVTVGNFGNFGLSDFLDYTVIGSAVNLAARIESQAEGGKILISARTHSLIRDEVKTLPHPDLVLKGIPEP